MVEFDRESFARAIHLRAFDQRLSMRDVAGQAKVSPSTITRVVNQRKGPDCDTLVRLLKWLNGNFEDFIKGNDSEGKIL
jgi:transcriptional regulator with XRE-family HTH domain